MEIIQDNSKNLDSKKINFIPNNPSDFIINTQESFHNEDLNFFIESLNLYEEDLLLDIELERNIEELDNFPSVKIYKNALNYINNETTHYIDNLKSNLDYINNLEKISHAEKAILISICYQRLFRLRKNVNMHRIITFIADIFSLDKNLYLNNRENNYLDNVSKFNKEFYKIIKNNFFDIIKIIHLIDDNHIFYLYRRHFQIRKFLNKNFITYNHFTSFYENEFINKINFLNGKLDFSYLIDNKIIYFKNNKFFFNFLYNHDDKMTYKQECINFIPSSCVIINTLYLKNLNREKYLKLKKNLSFENYFTLLNVYNRLPELNISFDNYIENLLKEQILNKKEKIENIKKIYNLKYYNKEEVDLARKKFILYKKYFKKNKIYNCFKHVKEVYSSDDIIELTNNLINYFSKNGIFINIDYDKISKPVFHINISRIINNNHCEHNIKVEFKYDKNETSGGAFYPVKKQVIIYTNSLNTNSFSYDDIITFFHELGHSLEILFPEFDSALKTNPELISIFFEFFILKKIHKNKKHTRHYIDYLFLKPKFINSKNLNTYFNFDVLIYLNKLIDFNNTHNHFNFLSYMKSYVLINKINRFFCKIKNK